MCSQLWGVWMCMARAWSMWVGLRWNNVGSNSRRKLRLFDKLLNSEEVSEHKLAQLKELEQLNVNGRLNCVKSKWWGRAWAFHQSLPTQVLLVPVTLIVEITVLMDKASVSVWLQLRCTKPALKINQWYASLYVSNLPQAVDDYDYWFQDLFSVR